MNDTSQFFRQSGYVVSRNVFDPNSCSILARTAVAALADESIIEYCDRDAEGRVTRIEGVLHNFALVDWVSSDNFLRASGPLLGKNWVILLNRHNHLTFDYGEGPRGARMHRDSLQWSRPFLTAVIYLDGPDGAAVWPRLIPGSHLWPIKARPNGGGYWLDEDEQADLAEQALFVPLSPGDVLFLDPLTFHCSGKGSVAQARSVLTFAIRSFDELSNQPARNEVMVHGEAVYRGQTRWAQKNG